MNVSRRSAHYRKVEIQAMGAAKPSRAREAERQPLRFSSVYDDWFRKVLPWLRAFGVREQDLEDVAQEVFVVVRRKLPHFDGENLAGFLYRIAQRTASDYRRRAWFKHIFRRAKELSSNHVHAGPSPAEALERKEAETVLFALLSKLTEKRRVAFILFEIEGYSGEEIAALEQIPLATVRTRLHHARKDFVALVAAYRKAEDR